VTKLFPNVAVLSVREALGNVSRTLSRLGWAFKIIAAIVLTSGLLVLAGAVSADQHRRVRDAVIFKVCGATRPDVLTAFAAEFSLLGLTSVTVSLITGSLAAMAVIRGPLDMTYHLHPVLLVITLLVGMFLVMTCGLLGTWKALRLKPAVYLRRD
jgi:putative ABC transport system permease protein